VIVMTIRVVQPEDLPKLLALYGHLHATEAPPAPAPEMQAHWRAFRAHPGLTCLAGWEGQTLVASCCVAVIPNLTRGCRPYALIENVVTHSDYRRRGFGSAIVKRAMELAWEAGCYKAMLMTGSKRPETHRFYEQCGLVADKTGFVASRWPNKQPT
jgi:GNAT superfamily N-acetyltransferase